MITPPTLARISGLKILTLETTIFGLKMIVKSGIELFISRLNQPFPSEIPAKLPGQLGHSGQIFLHWAAATLRWQVGFQNKKNCR